MGRGCKLEFYSKNMRKLLQELWSCVIPNMLDCSTLDMGQIYWNSEFWFIIWILWYEQKILTFDYETTPTWNPLVRRLVRTTSRKWEGIYPDREGKGETGNILKNGKRKGLGIGVKKRDRTNGDQSRRDCIKTYET